MHVPWSNPSIIPEDTVFKLEDVKKGDVLIEEFEALLSKYVGTSHATCVFNGSIAIMAALMACNLKNTDKIIVPTYAFASVATAPIIMGAKVVLVDCDPETLNADFAAVEDASKKFDTAGIIHVDVAGVPPDVEKYKKLISAGQWLIEDAAESLGTEYKNVKVGALNHTTTFSFHPAKQMTTFEGGAVFTGDDVVLKKLKLARNHGMTSVYEHTEMGFNFRMTPMQALMGISQLKRIQKMIEQRKNIMNLYKAELGGYLSFQKIPEYVTSWSCGAAIAFTEDTKRDDLIKFLSEKNIETRIMWKPIHMQKFHSKHVSLFGDYKNATSAFNTMLSLPIGNGMNDDQVWYVINTIKKYYNDVKIGH